nr:hypothetical protein [Mycobacterium colombiense]
MTILSATNRALAPRRRPVTCAYRYYRLVERSETGTPRIDQAPNTSGITLTAKTVGDLHGRVLTAVALEGASQRFTPVALAIPTEMNIEFDISWQAEAWSYVVGDNR